MLAWSLTAFTRHKCWYIISEIGIVLPSRNKNVQADFALEHSCLPTNVKCITRSIFNIVLARLLLRVGGGGGTGESYRILMRKLNDSLKCGCESLT